MEYGHGAPDNLLYPTMKCTGSMLSKKQLIADREFLKKGVKVKGTLRMIKA